MSFCDSFSFVVSGFSPCLFKSLSSLSLPLIHTWNRSASRGQGLVLRPVDIEDGTKDVPSADRVQFRSELLERQLHKGPGLAPQRVRELRRGAASACAATEGVEGPEGRRGGRREPGRARINLGGAPLELGEEGEALPRRHGLDPGLCQRPGDDVLHRASEEADGGWGGGPRLGGDFSDGGLELFFFFFLGGGSEEEEEEGVEWKKDKDEMNDERREKEKTKTLMARKSCRRCFSRKLLYSLGGNSRLLFLFCRSLE